MTDEKTKEKSNRKRLPRSVAKHRRYLLSQIRKSSDEGTKAQFETRLANLLAPHKDKP